MLRQAYKVKRIAEYVMVAGRASISPERLVRFAIRFKLPLGELIEALEVASDDRGYERAHIRALHELYPWVPEGYLLALLEHLPEVREFLPAWELVEWRPCVLGGELCVKGTRCPVLKVYEEWDDTHDLKHVAEECDLKADVVEQLIRYRKVVEPVAKELEELHERHLWAERAAEGERGSRGVMA